MGSTAPPPIPPSVHCLERSLRAVALSVLGGVLVGGVAGVFGTTEATGESSAHGIDLEVTWPRTTRSGLPLAMDIDVSSADPLPPLLTITLSSSFVQAIETLTVVPAHRSQRAASDRLVIELEGEPGQRSTEIRVEGRVSPSARGMHRGLLRVGSGPEIEMSTFVWP